MNLYNQYIISYDITDTKKRTKLFESLKDLGLISIQKSVMWGFMNKSEYNASIRLIKKYMDKDDRIFISRIDLLNKNENKLFGYNENILKYPEGYEIV
jgi:CRISPR-associated protein Cas2